MKQFRSIKHCVFFHATVLFLALSSTSVQAAPSAPPLISPIGMNLTQPPLFEWSEVATATWYRLWVKDEMGVVFAQWLKAVNVCVNSRCTFAPGVNTQSTTTWQVRGYDGVNFGAWSVHGMFWESLSPPGTTTLLAPLNMTSERTPEFSWAVVPDATWYKLQLFDANEAEILNQWLRADSGNVECDDIACTKTPIVNLNGDFEWRIRTYNPAGLGPNTPLEFVERTYEIGDTGPGGGIVFSVSDDGTSGLEAAREDFYLDGSNRIGWGCEDLDIVGIFNTTENPPSADAPTGAEKTTAILNKCTARPIAASVASSSVWPNGQTDGYLPDHEELDMMYKNIGPGCDGTTNPGCNVGGFADDIYWSSTEFDGNWAWCHVFEAANNGIQTYFDKSSGLRVRAVRAI